MKQVSQLVIVEVTDFQLMGEVADNFFVGIASDVVVVEVDYHADVEEVGKDLIEESLECHRGIRKSKQHDKPFKRSVAGSEHGFPLFAGGQSG